MTVKGVITKFDYRTWWGEVKLHDGTTVKFHGTTVNGWRNDCAVELVGECCDVLFNRNGDLFDIRILDAI